MMKKVINMDNYIRIGNMFTYFSSDSESEEESTQSCRRDQIEAENISYQPKKGRVYHCRYCPKILTNPASRVTHEKYKHLNNLPSTVATSKQRKTTLNTKTATLKSRSLKRRLKEVLDDNHDRSVTGTSTMMWSAITESLNPKAHLRATNEDTNAERRTLTGLCAVFNLAKVSAKTVSKHGNINQKVLEDLQNPSYVNSIESAPSLSIPPTEPSSRQISSSQTEDTTDAANVEVGRQQLDPRELEEMEPSTSRITGFKDPSWGSSSHDNDSNSNAWSNLGVVSEWITKIEEIKSTKDNKQTMDFFTSLHHDHPCSSQEPLMEPEELSPPRPKTPVYGDDESSHDDWLQKHQAPEKTLNFSFTEDNFRLFNSSSFFTDPLPSENNENPELVSNALIDLLKRLKSVKFQFC